MIFFRAQHKGHSFTDMQAYSSGDGGDGFGELGGLCATRSANGEHNGGIPFGGCWSILADDDEVVVFDGIIITEVYDGYRVEPIAEVARFTVGQWCDMLDTGEAESYED